MRLIEQGIWGFLATAGFGVLFNVPTRLLVLCGLTGAVGLVCRRALLDGGAHPVAATFVGALVVGLVGYTQARRCHAPRLIFTVTGIIPMVPGVPAFETIMYFIRDDVATGLESGVITGLLVSAIGAGLVTARQVVTLGDTLYPPITRGLWPQPGDRSQAEGAQIANGRGESDPQRGADGDYRRRP